MSKLHAQVKEKEEQYLNRLVLFNPLVGGPIKGRVVKIKNFGQHGFHLNVAVNASAVCSIREDQIVKILKEE